MKKILMFMICMILLIGIASAQMEFDNRKQEIEFGKDISEYGKIEIRDWFGLTKLTEIELKENTEQCPESGCYANQTITMYQDAVLIEDIRFDVIKGSGYVDYNIQYKVNNVWVDYNLGDEVKGSGDGIIYEVEITGRVQGFSIVDWKIKSQGFWIEDWAVWSSALNTNIIAGWDMRVSTAGTLTDVVTGSANGTLINSPGLVAGLIGNATNYATASSQAINISDDKVDLDNSTDFTISLWVNFTADTSSANIVGKGINGDHFYLVGVDSSYSPRFRMYQEEGTINVNALGTSTLNDDEWHHIVGTFDRSTGNVSIYVNGDIEKSVTNILINNTNLSIGNLHFGTGPYGITYELNGTLDEVYMWNETLSPFLISDLYNSGIGITYVAGAVGENVTVTLISPADAYTNLTNTAIIFNATAEPTSSIINLTNATLFIWGSDFAIEEETTNIITGNQINSTIWNVILSTTDIFEWNVFACAENTTGTTCEFADSNSTLITIPFSIISESFNSETTEGSTETFELNITLASNLQISTVTLVYNNTNHTGTAFNIAGNNYSLTESIIIPNVEGVINNSFYWHIISSDGSERNSTQHNQTVSSLSLDDCSSNTIKLFNFTIVDEETQINMSNTTLEVAVNIFSFDESISILNFSTSNNSNPFQICLNINVTNNTEYSLNVIAKYEVSDPAHAIEYYNIVNSTLNNETQLQSIILYDLLSTDSTEFQLTFKGSDFVAVEGALINLQRQYIEENIFKTVELPLTDSNGQTVLHMVRNDVLYNIEVIKGGIILGSFRDVIAFCDDFTIGDCKIDLDAFSTEEEVFDYDTELGLIFTPPTFDNDTREIRVDFLIPDGTTKTVNLEVTKNDIFGNTSVCNSSLISSGGTLSCVIPSHVNDATVNIFLFVEGKEVVRDSLIISFTGYGTMGYFIAFIFILAFVFMFSDSKSGILIGLFLGFISTIMIGVIQGKLIGIGASGIWLLIIVMLMLWKLNKSKED